MYVRSKGHHQDHSSSKALDKGVIRCEIRLEICDSMVEIRKQLGTSNVGVWYQMLLSSQNNASRKAVSSGLVEIILHPLLEHHGH